MFYEQKYFQMPEDDRPPRQAMEEAEASWLWGAGGLLFSLFGASGLAGILSTLHAKKAYNTKAPTFLGRSLAIANIIIFHLWIIFIFGSFISYLGVSGIVAHLIAIVLAFASGFGFYKLLIKFDCYNMLLNTVKDKK